MPVSDVLFVGLRIEIPYLEYHLVVWQILRRGAWDVYSSDPRPKNCFTRFEE